MTLPKCAFSLEVAEHDRLGSWREGVVRGDFASLNKLQIITEMAWRLVIAVTSSSNLKVRLASFSPKRGSVSGTT
jgi:hypothetical protein